MRTHIICSRSIKKAIDRSRYDGKRNKEVRSETDRHLGLLLSLRLLLCVIVLNKKTTKFLKGLS